jgi:hypothetical protein
MPDEPVPSTSEPNSVPEQKKETPQPAAETPLGSWVPDARKALISQVLSILVIPVTVAATLYMTDFVKKPKPHMEYFAPHFQVEVQNPPSTVATKIANSPRLTLMYRDELGRMTSGQGAPLLHCAFWIDGGDWDSDCLEPFVFATRSIQRQLQVMVDEAARHQSEVSISPVLAAMTPNLAEARTQLANMDAIRTALEELSRADTPRAGSVALAVGVLNSGDADGVLESSALLTLPWGTAHAFTSGSRYTVVKAHGFEEVTFTTASYHGDTPEGTIQIGEEKMAKKLSDEIRAGKKIPFTIEVVLSNQHARISGTLEPED